MLGGVEEDIKVDEGHACLTNPDEAVEFVKQTRLRFARRRHRHQPRRLQIQRQASLHFDVIEGISKENSGHTDCHARQFERADRGSASASTRPAASSIPPRAEWMRTNICPRQNSA